MAFHAAPRIVSSLGEICSKRVHHRRTLSQMPAVLSVNVGLVRPIAAKSGVTGIDKRPSESPVAVTFPGEGGSGLAGDVICDTEHHGGPDQAVYAYAREDLDAWEDDLGRHLPCGVFGENLTTVGVDITESRIGERWRIGDDCVLQVTCPRVPCRTFAVWLGEQGWAKAFTRRAIPGTYLRVVSAGVIRPHDPVTVEFQPDNDVTVGLVFRALTSDRSVLPNLLASPYLTAEVQHMAQAGNSKT
jgi:MOSC domain-containing protein YiiM